MVPTEVPTAAGPSNSRARQDRGFEGRHQPSGQVLGIGTVAQAQRVSQVTEALITAGYDVAVGGLEQLITATMLSSGLLLEL